ncbi:MAG TPA: hypothetical protein VKA67_12035, partial [Verrucomicrobiae bacterium]|nr:hypothetical protein [Verrucomicrobiae bacterium]
MALITALAGSTAATHAQTVVISDDFESYTLGIAYGTTYNYGDSAAAPGAGIAPGPGGVGQAFEFFANLNSNVTANTGANLPAYAPTNNISATPSDYTLSFDMAIPAGSTNAGFGVVFNIFGNNGDSVSYSPDLSQITVGGGYHHYVVNLGTLGSVNGQPKLQPALDTSYQIQTAILGFPPTVTVAPEELQFDNILITITNQISTSAPPAMTVLAATPGSRWFAQNSSQVYNEEGMATVDTSQSWVGSATPAAPSSYSVTFADWNTAPNFRYQIQFVPNASVNPYSVFTGPNDFALTITRQATNFLASVDYKTNLPNAGTVSNLLSMTTSNATVGTWTLSFTSDTNGMVTAPDGETGSFLVPPKVAVIFTNPCPIFYGIAPFNTQGYGQWVDVSRITTTNVAGVAINDDFTKDDGLATNVWNTA